jgi:ribosomal protein S18 acetylase RimI-like enzyme
MPNRLQTIPTLDRPTQSSPTSAAPTSASPNLVARPITKVDFDKIVQVVDHWWEGPIAVLTHPMFFYEFGQFARVVEDTANEGRLVGFLLGFAIAGSDDAPGVGYVHLVGIDPQYRRKGVARALYAEFTNLCREAGAQRLKAITTAGNVGSIRFHEAIGFTATEDPDYAGPGRKRVVFTKVL